MVTERRDDSLKRVARGSAWLLLLSIIVLVISGWGITRTEVIYNASFGLIDRGLANAIHRGSNVLAGIFLLTHVLVNIKIITLTKYATRGRLINAVLIAVGLVLLGAVVYMETWRAPPEPLPAGEVEATEYLGQKLTPIRLQDNNALRGTQYIDRDSYRLVVDGLVEKSLSLAYDNLLEYPQESRLTDLNCVEGWNFTAKWTGPRLSMILDDAGVKPGVTTVIFHTVDVPAGYSSLDLSYIREHNIIIALKLNDITLPASRGFPFQVVAESKFGYKWAKWVDSIELTDRIFEGYWERQGYNNNADINGPITEPGYRD